MEINAIIEIKLITKLITAALSYAHHLLDPDTLYRLRASPAKNTHARKLYRITLILLLVYVFHLMKLAHTLAGMHIAANFL